MNRPEMLRPAAYLGLDSRLDESLLKRMLHLEDFSLSDLSALSDLFSKCPILIRFKKLESQVLEFPADPRHAETVRERCVDLPRF